MQRKAAHYCLRGTAWPAEADQLFAYQYHSPDVAVLAVFGIFEAETAFHPQPTVVTAAQAHAGGVHRLIQPLHACRLAGITADFGGAFCRRARGGEDEERRDAHGH